MWLDDIRPAPIDWIWVKNYQEAIDILTSGQVEQCSLDHDLGFDHYAGKLDTKEKSGYDVVCWMAEHNVWPKIIEVHSMNTVGRDAMRQMIARYKPK